MLNIFSLLIQIRKRYEDACKAYQRALDLQPSHVDARINYSTIQQRLGLVDEAFETLREYVLDAGSSLPVSGLFQVIVIQGSVAEILGT